VSKEAVPDTKRLANPRVWNLWLALVFLVQAALILALSNGFSIPVIVPIQTDIPGSAITLQETVLDLCFSSVIAAFLLLAMVDHLFVGTVGARWYERNLLRNINYARWIEYSISASLMIVLIAMLPGITNLYTLIALFSLNATMISFGLLMERVNQDSDEVTWWPFAFGCLAGIVPWICITIALVLSTINGDLPGFVIVIFVSLFFLFNCFGLNQWLQYRGGGRYADYLYGEKVYVVLSLVAKSALAWQIFAGTMSG